MVDVNDLSAEELQEIAAAKLAEASLQQAVRLARLDVERREKRLEDAKQLLSAAKTRLKDLESGKVKPPPYRAPKAGDHAITVPTGKLKVDPK